MYEKFFVKICEKYNNLNTFDLVFRIYDTDIAQKWAHEITKKYELYEVYRFKSWQVDGTEEKDIVNKLNKQIDIINQFFGKLIGTKVRLGTTQASLNCLHKVFEDLRGTIEKGTDKFNNSPQTVKDAIQNLNILIHRYEDYNASKPSPLSPEHPFASLTGTFKERPRYKLCDLDYDHFTFMWKFGEVYINYCEVGKPILDVFKDDDHHIGKENIKPLHYYSADFMIKFGPNTPDWFYNKRLRSLKSWLEKKGYNPYDKKLSLGLIPVAKIDLLESGLRSIPQSEIVKKLSIYQKLQKVEVF